VEMKKVVLITLGVLFLSGCAQTTALLGPALIGGHSGSMTKASLHYSTGYLIKKSTGKSTSEHALGMIQEPIKIRKEKKIKKDFTKFLKEHILSTRKQLLQNN
tara:strand:+ start:446 stop:754 length:309 start_codon:yes stop_codon:yes gene_type:complete